MRRATFSLSVVQNMDAAACSLDHVYALPIALMHV